MSLTVEQQIATKAELRAAMDLVGLSVEDLAQALQVTPAVIQASLELKGRAIENPWVLKEYLADQARAQGLEPIEISALRGDYHQYWFLDSRVIDERTLR